MVYNSNFGETNCKTFEKTKVKKCQVLIVSTRYRGIPFCPEARHSPAGIKSWTDFFFISRVSSFLNVQFYHTNQFHEERREKKFRTLKAKFMIRLETSFDLAGRSNDHRCNVNNFFGWRNWENLFDINLLQSRHWTPASLTRLWLSQIRLVGNLFENKLTVGSRCVSPEPRERDGKKRSHTWGMQRSRVTEVRYFYSRTLHKYMIAADRWYVTDNSRRSETPQSVSKTVINFSHGL